MKNALILFLFTIGLISCRKHSLVIDNLNTQTNLDFRHYEQDLFNLNSDDLSSELERIAPKYPVFINGDYKHPTKLNQLNDYLNNELSIKLFNDWNEKIKSYGGIKDDLNKAFSHFHYYYPKDSLPTIYTYISGINHEEPIVVENNRILIGIDLFYGADYEIYKQLRIPQYRSKNFDKSYLTPTVIRAYGKDKFSSFLQGETFLDNMIALGKLEYFIESMMPSTMDTIRFQFTTKQMNWCYSHEKHFWKHLITKNYLFSKNLHHFKKFLEYGPFASSLEKNSPGRAGIFIGYKIVKNYMEKNPDVRLQELMINTDFTAIFKASKYNP